jgi:hypothetical protein
MNKIVSIDSEYNLLNLTLIDGLTPDKVKRKYIWLLNAVIENAVVGEDDYGLVWYLGNWYGGEWEDGTWYSGIWYDGEWKNGNFYSYRFDKKQLLLRNKRILEKDNPEYSEFRRGIWRRGNFYNGYFGPDALLDDDDNEVDWDSGINVSIDQIVYWNPRWEGGNFYNGIFRNAAWMQSSGITNRINSIFHNGIFFNSQWINGTFLNGIFQGDRWWGGNFTGGDFVKGTWMSGSFNQTNLKIKSRFGSWPLTGATDMPNYTYTGPGLTTWHNGQFINGEFHSGLNVVSGITSISNNHNRSWWLGGTWQNGVWYGGTFAGGEFNNGYWFEGYWSGGTFNNGFWNNGFWLNGTINGGYFNQGIFKNVTVNGGELGYQAPEWLVQKQSLENNKLTISPKIYEG